MNHPSHFSADEALERAADLVPLLRQRSAEANLARRIPAGTMRELIDSGLLRLLQPVRYGGLEMDLEVFAQTVMIVSSACGSAGWVYSIFANHQWMLGMFPDEAQREVWGDNPDALTAASFVPAGKAVAETGGYRLSGKWGFCSGCDNSQWIALAGVSGTAGDPPQPEIKMFLLPMTDCQIEDNWHVLGMRGTGSKNVIVDNVWVPAHRLVDLIEMREGKAPGRNVNTGPLYRTQALASFGICLCLPPVGIARGAHALFVEQMKSRAGVTGKRLAGLTSIQTCIAEAETMTDCAELLLRRDARMIHDTAASGKDLTMQQRARSRRDHAYAAQLAYQATEKLLRASGGHALFDDSAIQQSFRDVTAAAAHLSNNWDNNGSSYGALSLGLPLDGLIR